MVSGAPSPAPLPTRAELERLPARLLHPGSATKSRVSVVASGGRELLIKDVHAMHPWVRALYGRRVLRREERVLAALDGMAGVPRLYGRIDADALASEYLAAEPLQRRLAPARLRRACLAFGERVAELHARGVVHLDLRQKRNVLVDAEGGVYLIDFQSAWVLGTRGVRGALLRLLARLDRSAVLKFKARYVPELLDERERRAAARLQFLTRLWVFHRIGSLLRVLLRRRRIRSP